MSIKLIDTGGAVVLGHVSRRVSGDDERLIDALVQAAGELLGAASAGARAGPRSDGLDPGETPPPALAVASPWYTRWWLWTAAAVVVAGGAGAAVLLAGGDDAPGSTRQDGPVPGVLA